MELTAKNVHETICYCLFRDEEIVDGKPIKEPVVAEGIMSRFGFEPDRLNEKKEDIISMIEQLTDDFKLGMSFLNACVRKDGVLWGEHKSMDELFTLGIAVQKVERVPIPANLLPGGMPYFLVK